MNDIAICETEVNIIFNSNVGAIAIEHVYTPANTKLVAFGFGCVLMMPYIACVTESNELLYTNLTAVDNTHPKCNITPGAQELCTYSPPENLTDGDGSTCTVSSLLVYFSKKNYRKL